MKAREFIIESPQPGHTIDVEFGDLLIETEIVDVTENGVVVHLDETAMRLILEAKDRRKVVTEGYLNENQEWDVYTVIQGKKADFKGSISAPDENSAIQAVYKDPRTYGYVSRAYAWVPFVKPKGAPLPPDIGLIRDKIVNSNLPKNTKNMLTSMITGNYPGGKDSPEQYYKTGKFSPKVQKYIDKISQQDVAEAKYQGRTVQLGKRMAGDVKKFKVYVKNKKGNVIKVNFGQKGVKIKKNNPARRKSFRARHNCSTAKDRTTARYWSCRAW